MIITIVSTSCLQAKESDIQKLCGHWGDINTETGEYMDVNSIVIRKENDNYNLDLHDFDLTDPYEDIDINCDLNNTCKVSLRKDPEHLILVFKIKETNQMILIEYNGNLKNTIKKGQIYIREGLKAKFCS